MKVRFNQDDELQKLMVALAHIVREYLQGKGEGFRKVTTVLLTYYPDGSVTLDAHGDDKESNFTIF